VSAESFQRMSRLREDGATGGGGSSSSASGTGMIYQWRSVYFFLSHYLIINHVKHS